MKKKAMQDQTLLEVTVITDDDTGIYDVGEIDFGIHGQLEDYLRNHGEKGKNDIIKTLEYLKGEVEEQWKNINKKDLVKSLKENK